MIHIKSHTLVTKDFDSDWYKRWAKELKQDKHNLDNHALRANKFWQNAALVQALWERLDFSRSDLSGVGFGVGQERLPALFAHYGVQVMATDQDFTTAKAKHWKQHELAESAQSLNRLGICDPKKFKEMVSYMPIDMTKISKKLAGKYDFVWSNCALGHLGSIDAGLDFIENSLDCLKPGGMAVHTTEINVLSNTKTVDAGSTVIFRLRDIQRLQNRLVRKGYRVSPLRFTLGTRAQDSRVSLRPQYGNDYSKIQVGGHLATQAILIIHKPLQPYVSVKAQASRIKHESHLNVVYAQNIRTLFGYKRKNPLIAALLKSQKAPLGSIKITPAQKEVKVRIKKGTSKEVFLDFTNRTPYPLCSLYSRLSETKPIVLGTSDPKDRESKFQDKSWVGSNNNRPAHDLRIKKSGVYELADHVRPRQNFSFAFTLDSNKLETGTYTEEFSVLQEGVGWIDESAVTVKVQVY
ncbi:MAG TPA: hypothetical protein VK694_02625 [Verrucomicrobiae bacterium]|nr:hypothetical protein [Verrucomicrobiae bacterium]